MKPHLLLVGFSGVLLAGTPTVHAQTVGEMIDRAHGCTTGTVAGWELRQQLAAAENCWYPTALVSVTPTSSVSFSGSILRYMDPRARDMVFAAGASRTLTVISAFRTTLEQYYLFTATASACAAVARVGTSNHESGTAVDVSPNGNTASVRSALVGVGCSWYGPGDPAHFNCPASGGTIHSVETFQRLWNLNHPDDLLAVDGDFGPMSRARMRATSIHGFATLPCTEPPPPPPPCDSTAAGFSFSCDGPAAGVCVVVSEPGDPDAWEDNHFCSPGEIGMLWSSAGPIAGMRCVNVNESADAESAAWADNHLCVPTDSRYLFAWSSAGPISGMDCVQWAEPSEAASEAWTDNFLCVTEMEVVPDTDAGAMNADAGPLGEEPDAAHADTGPGRDAGTLRELSSGCGCSASRATSPGALFLLAAALGTLIRLRRKR